MAEVEETLERLTAHRSVQGVLVLSSESGKVIRWTGQMLEQPGAGSTTSSMSTMTAASTSTAAVAKGDHSEADEAIPAPAGTEAISEPAKKYAALVRRIVQSAVDGVSGMDSEVGCSDFHDGTAADSIKNNRDIGHRQVFADTDQKA